ncbi:MAG: pirin-like C-terminal cupin domain-containing protein, partial [Sphingomonas sp.]
ALEAGARITLPAPHGRNVFLYVVRGQVRVAGDVVDRWHLVELNDDGDSVVVEGMGLDDETGSLILYGHADPIGEPVVAHGPFVMNTPQEIAEAVRDYQAGRFEGVAVG